MLDRSTKDARASGARNSDQLEGLAGQVLSAIAARALSSDGAIEEARINRLIAAVALSDEGERDKAVAQLMDSGVTLEALVDHYIPEAARRMGDAWCRDAMNFADVTIGSARLQALLRDLSRRGVAGQRRDPMAPQVLMVVRQDDYHTLGAMVAVQQLRRLGVGVHVSIGQPDRDVLQLGASRDFDMIMLSFGGCERLETLRKFVEKMRDRAGRKTPIVIGGAVMRQLNDVVSESGVDFATADPEEALRRCGLKIPLRDAGQPVPLD